MPREISSDYFESLYTRNADEEVIKLEDGPGITIIKPYPPDHPEKSGYKMFIRFYFSEGAIEGYVNMIDSETRYVIYNENQFRNNFVNFNISPTDKISFNSETQKIIIRRFGINHPYTINQFISLLISNHLTRRDYTKEFIKWSKIHFLKSTFWLVNKKYNLLSSYGNVPTQLQTNYISVRSNETEPEIITPEEPFFRYFNTHRNILFISLIPLMLILGIGFNQYIKCGELCDSSWLLLFRSDYFSITNPLLLFAFFMLLVIVEFTGNLLAIKCESQSSLLYKIHKSLYHNSFKLRL